MKRVLIGFALGALCAGFYGADMRKRLLAEVAELQAERHRVVEVAKAASMVGGACADYARVCRHVMRRMP